MKFRKIILRLDNDNILSWNPLDIHKIEIYDDYIRINDEVIEKSDTYFPNWDYFIRQLNMWFIL